MKLARALAGLTVALLAGGCTQPLVVDSQPTGALVFVDGAPVGHTPVTIHVNRSQYVRSYDLRLELRGYAAHEQVLEREQAVIMGSRWPERVLIRLTPAPD